MNKQFIIHLVGHGHIDPTWLWRWTEGYEEIRSTFRSALERMKEFPTFKFSASSACFYKWIKIVEPEMFDEIRQRVKQGRWEIVGGWWVEPDCNLPCGESFVRHGLYAQKFFEKEFGLRARVGFNPDSFGHAGTLPQILKKLGIEFYVYMRPSPPNEMDYPEGTTFWWRANDGTEILATRIDGYGGDGEHVLKKFRLLPHSPYTNKGQKHFLGLYGVGNHGGGPTKTTIKLLIQAQKDPQMPHLIFSTLSEYFDAITSPKEKMTIPTITTDLQHHARGCYTAHAEIKKLNRATEHALMSAERLASVLWLLENREFPKATFQSAWELLLYNQFHDILAGTSIEKAYEDARDQLGAARNTAIEISNLAIQRIARNIKTTAKGNTIVLFNPLPWTIEEVVKAPAIAARYLSAGFTITDDNHQPIPFQPVAGERIGNTDYIFKAKVPGLGYRCYYAIPSKKPTFKSRLLKIGTHFIENTFWHLEFDQYTGELRRLYDKKQNIEVIQRGNILACLVDQSDTWSHGYDEWRVEAGRFAKPTFQILENGPVKATLRVITQFRSSVAEQFISLYDEIDAIDLLLHINWQEHFTMLKLAYETRIEKGVVTCDTAYGCQQRNIDGWEEPCQKWVDLTGEIDGKPYGLAILNDSKYAFDVCKNIVRMTLLRSPAYAFHDRSRYDSSQPWRIMDQGWHYIRLRLLPHKGSWEEAEVPCKAWEWNEPPIVHIESTHKGPLPSSSSFLNVTPSNIIISVIKQSEDNEDLIIRGYECAGKKTKATIESEFWKRKFSVLFHPHEIKTLRINTKTWKVKETNLLEE